MNNLAVKTNSPLASFAKRFDVDPQIMEHTLKTTVFKQSGDEEVTNEQMVALMIVADQHKLNPFLKEIHAFPDKKGGIVPVVGVDGWSNLINSNKNFDGMEFRHSDNLIVINGGKPCYEWTECLMYRKDRGRPVIIRESLDEVYRPAFKGNGRNGPYTIDGPWQTHTKRMLRHKAMIQCARVAFGFTGIYDEDEAERIIEARDSDLTNVDYEELKPEIDPQQSRVASVKDQIIKKSQSKAANEDGDTTVEEMPHLLTAKDKSALKGKISKCRTMQSLEDLLPECMTFAKTEWHEELRKAYGAKVKALA